MGHGSFAKFTEIQPRVSGLNPGGRNHHLGRGQIKAFVCTAGNPVIAAPNAVRLEEALENLEFMVSIDFYLNETSKHADIILPPTGA
ncbi:MAG: anaerobic selenocysteine-containing dehydrogenase [Oleiphilaceae bacterium]|jgi:anaerobic selenocysteine-containing dehydrogenase